MKVTKISKSQYDALKKTYLHKNRCMYSLYRELNDEVLIDKQIFFRIINKIREEEGLKPFYYSKKKNKKSNINKYPTYQYST
jgi:predicted RNase H-related nuclease YkuK (DUF458 family)